MGKFSILQVEIVGKIRFEVDKAWNGRFEEQLVVSLSGSCDHVKADRWCTCYHG